MIPVLISFAMNNKYFLRSLLFCFAVLLPLCAFAHPGTGIVRDSKGNIYYTNLKHVWKLAPNGVQSIVVRNVHTHELYIDAQDNLYGEHLWYEGEATDRWGHRIWRLSPDGTLTNVIPSRVGFRDDYDDFHFVRDTAEAMYWVDRGEPTAVRKRITDGTVSTIATAPFRNVRWMTVSAEGTIYLIDIHDLIRINSDGSVHMLVENLADRRRSFLFGVDTHAIMGLWTDQSRNVYAAIASDRVVKRISPAGAVSIFARAE